MRGVRLVIVSLLIESGAICAESPFATLDHALAEARRGDCKAAIADLQIALSQNPASIPALNALGLCESMLSQPESATNSFEKVVRLQPQAWQAWNNLGANYLALRRVDDAEHAFRKAVHFNPTAGSGWFNLASALLEKGNKLEAFRALDRAQRCDPHDAKLNRAWLRVAAAIANEAGYEIDNHEYALAYERLLLVERPLSQEASWNNLMGYAEFKLNKNEEAEHHLQTALQGDPNNEDYLLDIGEFLAAYHAYKEAGEFFEIGAKRMPNSRRIRFGLAIANILRDRRDEATASLERLLYEFPSWEPVYPALGECYEDSSNWSALIKLGKEFQAKNPTNPAGWYFEGLGHERLSDHETTQMVMAISLLRHAVILDEASSRYHFELGKAFAETSDVARAVHELKEAVRLDPDHQRAHYVLARVYQRLGQTQLAEIEFQTHSKIKARGEKDAYIAMLRANQHFASRLSGENRETK